MRTSNTKLSNYGFVSVIGLLLTIIIIVALYYLMANSASKRTIGSSNSGSSSVSVLDRARQTVKDINKKQTENLNQ